jgi:hypothetical protein
MSTPVVGSLIHYVSYGTPGGEFVSQCTAAIVTAIGVDHDEVALLSLNLGETRRTGERVDLCAFYPNGISFKEKVRQDEPGKQGGTWHRVCGLDVE